MNIPRHWSPLNSDLLFRTSPDGFITPVNFHIEGSGKKKLSNDPQKILTEPMTSCRCLSVLNNDGCRLWAKSYRHSPCCWQRQPRTSIARQLAWASRSRYKGIPCLPLAPDISPTRKTLISYC
ncbi:hypothetical protein M9H77_03791 [Catharanthus roseus]|uniref:Uncharacterized protein n=1 Tax=Catharanthus roseus TaxID=4058 RepID=A0ACC0CCP0_CATRO|nr:hypothetical protein M9H77_03791 [Catharanthus roseus]